jgi:hypothetical protein
VVLLRRRALGQAMRTGVTVAAGLAIVWLANQGLERNVLGASLRSGRAASTAAGVGADAGLRLREAFVYSFGLNGWPFPLDVVVGGVIAAGLALACWTWRPGAPPPSDDRRRLALIASALSGSCFVASLLMGLRFIPGTLMAAPVAVVGLVLGGRGDPRRRFVVAVAVAALPVVWATQCTGGASPQWAGRYQLPTGFLLFVAGVVALAGAPQALRVAVTAAAVVVTLFGAELLRVRSHAIGESAAALAQGDVVLVTQQHHIFRETGSLASERRWLTADDDAELQAETAALRDAGIIEFRLVEVDRPTGTTFEGFAATNDVTTIPYLPGHQLVLTTYTAIGSAAA